MTIYTEDDVQNISKSDNIPSEILVVIERAEQQLLGWCWREKSIALVKLILALRPEICVEIGVFGGRSAVPCAAALRHLGKGSLYAIETWSNSVAVEYATNETNDTWWQKIDFRPLKTDFLRFIAENDLAMQTKIIEMPSGRAAILFDQIDFLHIDGAHSIINAVEDVIYYATKVRKDGIIILDDANWETIGPALEILTSMCGAPEFVKDPTEAHTFAIFRRR